MEGGTRYKEKIQGWVPVGKVLAGSQSVYGKRQKASRAQKWRPQKGVKPHVVFVACGNITIFPKFYQF